MEKLIAYVQHIYISDILHVSQIIRPQGGSCSSLDMSFTLHFSFKVSNLIRFLLV